jgi:hypothetical protein
MVGPGNRIEYRPLRAPRENRSALVEPPFAEVGGLLEENLAIRQQWSYDLQGRQLSELASQARSELLRGAFRWTSSYRDAVPPPCNAPARIVLAGHQPQLFHPGVWVKNFALDWIARAHGAYAVNLVVDSDTIKTNAVRVPGGSGEQPRIASIPLDLPGPVIPYEERRILSRPMFAEFGQRVARQIAPLVAEPLAGTFWPLAVERARQTDNLGACLAQSRHLLEGSWGLSTLEVPQSRVCQSESFVWLVAHVVAQLPRFRQVYNEVVHEYRRVHGIRNAAHPVPDLAVDGEWLEAPFWVWTAAEPARRPLFAARRGREVVLTDRQRLQIVLPLSDDGHATAAVGRLLELSFRGIKIRSRALMTTLWARLALGDLFLHGIGGAKYDQVTDALMERFFGLRPPGIMVLSATVHLPVDRAPAPTDDESTIGRLLRELEFHPERWLSGAPRELGDPAALVAEKLRWVNTAQTPKNAHERYLSLRRINAGLQPWVAHQRARLLARRAAIAEAARIERILSYREYAFCLYPEEPLREFLFGLLPGERG